MFNIDQIVKALQTDQGSQKQAMTGAAGLAAGLLMGGGGKKFLGSAVKMGALAAVGGLAYQAWQKHQQSQGQTAPGSTQTIPDSFIPRPQAEQEQLGKSLVRAMISAAKADGKIDGAEKDAIFARLKEMPLSAEEKAWVFDELNSPLDMAAVAARADTPEHAAEIYAASLVAIEADTEDEQRYLRELAQRLRLDPALVRQIHETAGARLPTA